MHTQNYYWILNVKSISVDNTSSDYVARLGGVNMPVGLLGCALLFSSCEQCDHSIRERERELLILCTKCFTQ